MVEQNTRNYLKYSFNDTKYAHDLMSRQSVVLVNLAFKIGKKIF